MKIIKEEIVPWNRTSDGVDINVLRIVYSYKKEFGEVFIAESDHANFKANIKKLRQEVKRLYDEKHSITA